MKKLTMLYRWIILSVLLQVIILSYINFVYLPNRGAIKATMYEFGDDSVSDRSIRLPSGAEKTAVSFNGLFAAYLKDGSLVVTDIQKGRTAKTITPSGGTFTYFRWLPDRDMLIYSTRSQSKGQVVVSTYEIDSSLERSYPTIKGLPGGSEVTDIELSPLTNVVYVLIKTGEKKTKMYKYNIMDNLSFVMNGGAGMTMKETSYSDSLFYQNGNGNIMKRNGKTGKASAALSDGKFSLLAVDSEDNAYVGTLDNDGKVTGILRGKAEQDSKDWQKLVLKSPAAPGDVFITPDGSVYTAERNSGKITGLDSGKSTAYAGELIEVLDDYTVSLDNGKLELKAIEK